MWKIGAQLFPFCLSLFTSFSLSLFLALLFSIFSDLIFTFSSPFSSNLVSRVSLLMVRSSLLCSFAWTFSSFLLIFPSLALVSPILSVILSVFSILIWPIFFPLLPFPSCFFSLYSLNFYIYHVIIVLSLLLCFVFVLLVYCSGLLNFLFLCFFFL